MQVKVHPGANGKEKCSRKEVNSQSCSFCCFRSSEPLLGCFRGKWPTLQTNATSLFSTVKRKHPCRDACILIVAGGMWPIILFHRGRSLQGLSQKAWPMSPRIQRSSTEFGQNRSEPRQPCTLYQGVSTLVVCSCSCTSEEWIMQSILLPTLVIFDVFLKAWALKAYKTLMYFFKLFHVCAFNVLVFVVGKLRWKHDLSS